jgi:hypothetical protein
MGSQQFDKAGILAVDFSGLVAKTPGFSVSSSILYPPGPSKTTTNHFNSSCPRKKSTP